LKPAILLFSASLSGAFASDYISSNDFFENLFSSPQLAINLAHRSILARRMNPFLLVTMASSDLRFLPKNLPPQDLIVAVCQKDLSLRGTPLSSQPGEPIIASVKHGPNVAIDEALTQNWVAKELNPQPETNLRDPRVHAF
jgi:hypothetical protein